MKRFIAAVVIVLLLVGGLVALRSGHKAKTPDQAELAIPVATAQAKLSDVPLTVDGIGTVQPLNTVNIRPMVSGPLTDIRFREGQDVRAGDVLARIDSRIYQATYDQAVAKKAQDEASLANAQRDLARYDKLAKTQYTTAQQADTQRATVAQDEAQVRQDQAQIDTARTNLGYTTITAPVTGRTGMRQVDLGNIVTSADATPLTVITTLRPIDVVFTLPQQTLPQVTQAIENARASGGAEVLALPQDGGPDATQGAPGTQAAATQVLDRGHVTVLDNEVDQNTGTIKLKAEFPNPDLRLWPGAFVNVRLLLRVDHNVVTVPTGAVQRGPQGAFVFVLGNKGDADTAMRHPVTVARQDENVAVISAGLTPGETVVTDGASRLTEGSKVRRLPSQTADGAASPPPG
jgi:multidrug efflux system membrane fusion protein